MDKRTEWKEIPTYNTSFHFKWQPYAKGIKYELMEPEIKQIVNHLEYNDCITTKDGLFKNLAAYCELNKLNVFDIVPLTFLINLDNNSYNNEIEIFSKAFNIIEEARKTILNNSQKANLYINNSLSRLFCSKDRRVVRSNIPKINDTYYDERNLWIIKPTEYNRGRGVRVFSSIEEMKAIIKDYSEGMSENNDHNFYAQEVRPSVNTTIILPESYAWESQHAPISNINNLSNLVKSRNFVIQKYIERPLLIRNRKFDIRVWVLLSQDYKCYFFKEGYLRLSSYDYSVNSNDKEIHLTNNAIQKNTANYGINEDGNQMSFLEFQEYLNQYHASSAINVRSNIYCKMKEIASLSLQSVRKKLNPSETRYCFEIFGYDFMIDADFNVWLIEVNTNPCLEESSKLLKELLPRMLDDAFRLTVDMVFPRKKLNESKPFDVKGYTEESMWEYISQVGLPKQPRVEKKQFI